MRNTHAREPASPRRRQDQRRGPGTAWLPSFGRRLAAACLVLGALLPAETATARDDGPLIVVLDGSGSMWGTIEGSRKSKLSLAREGLAEAIERRDGDRAIGLVTVGARSGGSCRAVDTAVEPGPSRLGAVSDVLGRFNPQGRGPIVLGLKAARDLVTTQSSAQFLLIHDGDDNCDGDLCAFASAFAKSHPRVKIHALSLGLKPSDRAGVACLTKATGGRWIEVDDANGVGEGLDQIIANLGGPQLVPARHPAAGGKTATGGTPPIAANGANLQLEAVLKATGTAVPSGVAWHVKAIGESGDDAFERRLEQASAAVKLAPGRYEVALETELKRTTRTIEVKADEPQKVSFALEGGFLDIRSAGRTADGVPKPVATIETLARDGGQERVVWSGTLGRTSGLLVPAGRYRVTLADGLARATQTIELNDGEARALALAPPDGRIRVSVAGLDSRQLANATVELAIDDPTAPDGKRPVARSAAASATFSVAPGTYHVTLDVFGQESDQIVVVPGGETVDARIGIVQMGLGVTSSLGAKIPAEGTDVRYRVWRADTLDEPLHVSPAAEPTFYLTPGKYQIESRLGQQNAVIVREFEIGRQRYGKLALRHEAGQVSFKLADDEPLTDSNAFWELRDQNHRLIWRTIAASPVMTLKAGLYTVLVEGAQKSYRAKFAVVAGHDQSVLLGEE